MADAKMLLDVSHISRGGGSLRVTIPKRVIEVTGLTHSDIVAFYLDGKKVTIEKLSESR